MLRQLIEDHRPPIVKCAGSPPTPIGLSALGAMLHGFYNGVENIFRRVAVELDGGAPEGDRWHRILLERAAAPRPNRPAVISVSLADRLSEYFGFRHFFRSAYPSTLRWDRMAGLVAGIEEVFRQMEDELGAFLQAPPS